MTTTPAPSGTPVRATLAGGPTVLLEYAGLRVLLDPTFDEPRSYEGAVVLTKTAPPALPADAVLPLDLVLVSHDQHADNLDVAGRALVERVLADGVPVLSTPAAGARIPGVTGLDAWASVELDGERPVTVTAVPALHGPEGADAPTLSGPVTGFVLEAADTPTVYVSGDNASLDLVGEVAARFPEIAVAILNTGAADVGRFPGHTVTLRGTDAAEAAGLLGDALVVPVHADSWAHFTESVDAVRTAFADAGLTERLVVLEPGTRTEVAPEAS
ncbi:MBL fold metallo-hydrolase [Luteimicrobium xylanilyticum]|uniref:N-acetylphosphatidylethanolamine-hydrolyzing phospholipase D n=1 Tax=Luteimicrobium xylanilyticum TaxID=1133546 RepID=A0A5P9QFA7_9MICO|nr:MBL fold metallo-hydrolase [Luteimicrobium xylanilyticum]QFV00145.1 N-acetylphosphatidylethanolamine-hydrolyzing phospholipase D [Luteimicrobium xylanilyticum]